MDGLKPNLIKYLNNSGDELLLKFFNKLINQDTLPQDWAESLLIMIPKKHQVLHPSKFRPITLNNRLSLCFTSLLEQKLTDFAQLHNLLGFEQFGIYKIGVLIKPNQLLKQS